MKSTFRWRISPLFSLITFCYLIAIEHHPYTPIVLVHGIMSDAYEMKPTITYIQKYLPGAYVKSVQLGSGMLTSLGNMGQQVEWLKKEIQADPHLTNGFNMIGHSQGGLVARAYVEQYNNPKVINYISWGTPQQGVFGTPGDYDKKCAWLGLMISYAHVFLYSSVFQYYVSLSNYWKDPNNYVLYLKQSSFLPYLNNEIPHKCSQLYKDNMCNLCNMVMVQSPQDDVIDPIESCHFGFYSHTNSKEIVDMFHSDIYLQDRIGLRTLYESGRLHLKIAQCTHTNYQEDELNFVENTLPFLR